MVLKAVTSGVLMNENLDDCCGFEKSVGGSMTFVMTAMMALKSITSVHNKS